MSGLARAPVSAVAKAVVDDGERTGRQVVLQLGGQDRLTDPARGKNNHRPVSCRGDLLGYRRDSAGSDQASRQANQVRGGEELDLRGRQSGKHRGPMNGAVRFQRRGAT